MLKRKYKYIFFIFLILCLFFFCLFFIGKRVSPKLIHYAELQIRKLSNLIIVRSITSFDLDSLNFDDMFIISRNSNNEITTIDFNTVLLNKVIVDSTVNIQENLRNLELGLVDDNNMKSSNGVVLRIPIGVVFNNFLFSNLGFSIPVRLRILGDMESRVNTKVTNYGINSALIEVTLDLTVREEVLLPISTKEISVTSSVPIAIKLIHGTVPNYYSNGISKSSTFSIPLE